MRIEQIRLRNFKAFKDVTLRDLPRFMVVVGANGTGKSTLFDVFGFLRDALDSNVRVALQKRGGFGEVRSRGAEGEPIEIEVKFRLDISGQDRLVTYHLIITERDRVPVIEREVLRYKRSAYGAPFHFLDFSYGHGFAVTNEDQFHIADEALDREQHEMDAPDILAVKGLGQFQRFMAASAFRNLIENWHVSDFTIKAARGSKDAGFAEHLSVDGDNLPLVAKTLYDTEPKIFQRILDTMARRVPGVDEVMPEETVDGRLVLRFRDGAFKDPFVSRWVSDGTIKMFAYLLLLYDPKPHPLLCVEEPENQLYPSLLAELAEEFEAYGDRGGQVFVSTHSPDFLNAVPVASIYWLKKETGWTRAFRAADDPQLAALVAAGDLPGWLWSQGMFDGAHPKA